MSFFICATYCTLSAGAALRPSGSHLDSAGVQPTFAAALGEDRYDYILAFYLARYAGLRIHECFRIDTAIAEDALRKNAITIKGKGGKIRTVPIHDAIIAALRERLSRTKRGHKLLVPDDMPTDDAIYRVQKFLLDHRKELQDEGDGRPLTFHGLRHTYATTHFDYS